MNSTTVLKFAFLGVLAGVAFWSGDVESSRAPVYEPAAAQVVETAYSSYRTDPSDQTDTTDSPPPEVGAASALVQDIETGETLFARDTVMRRPMASLTKLMTALLARKLFAPDDLIIMSESAVRQEGITGDFAIGERFSVRDLITAMLVVSSNDAAYALAESAMRSEPTNTSESTNYSEHSDTFVVLDRFISAMNEKAREIGMFETHFEDSTGLSSLNQSSAEDLARFARHLLTYDRELLAITAAQKVFIRERTTGTRRALKNINSFAGRPEFFGGKTGFTDEAGGNLLSVWQHGGHTYLIIVLGTENRFGDTEKLYDFITSR